MSQIVTPSKILSQAVGHLQIGIYPWIVTDGCYPVEIMKVDEDFIEAEFFIKESIPQNNEDASISKRLLGDTSERQKLH